MLKVVYLSIHQYKLFFLSHGIFTYNFFVGVVSREKVKWR